MFGGNNKKENINMKSNSVLIVLSGFNSLVKGMVVEGIVKLESDICIDGMIKGKLVCDVKVIIGLIGYVEGEICCQNVVVEGKFEGIFEVSEFLNVCEFVVVSGEVFIEKLIVQFGVIFNVMCFMGVGIVCRNGFGVRFDGKIVDCKFVSNVKENKVVGV